MKSHNIYKNLGWLNELNAEQAASLFLDCCGSDQWAQQMTRLRPFRLLESLYSAADETWFSLSVAERIAAFSIWPHGETDISLPGAESDPAVSFGLYKEKFGFIFVISASGKSSEEIRAIYRARLRNSVETEIQIASEEHWKIIETNLNNLLER